MSAYDSIIEASVNIIKELPVEIPQVGYIAGITEGFGTTDLLEEFQKGDNWHYPMGSSYLKMGALGISEYAFKAADKNDGLKKEFYTGIGIVWKEVAEYFNKYVIKIDNMLSEADVNEDERSRLISIRDNMKVLSTDKPGTFQQAVQLVYILWRIRGGYSTGCIGRLDVALEPFYDNDIRNGVTEEEILDTICELWRKLNIFSSGDTLINVMVGGSSPGGIDDSNRLSVLMLEATLKVRMSEPHINVRWHKGINKDVMDAAYKVQQMGHGQGTVYNDEVVIPALINAGVPEEWAYRYTNDGCTEIMIEGGSMIDFSHIDAVATVELTMNNGEFFQKKEDEPVHYWTHKLAPSIYKPDVTTGFRSGDPVKMKDYEEFYNAFLEQYKFQTRTRCDLVRNMYETRVKCGSLFLNGTYEYVLENGVDMFSGGLPVECFQLFSGSVPTAADCVMAVKKVIFEDKQADMSTLIDALKDNYENYPELRQRLKNAPKFGNDIDEVDMIAADIARHYCSWLEEYRKETGFHIWPCLLGWQFLSESYGIWATPDGRKWKDPIAEHYCATPGCAKKGPTALICSIGKAELAKAYGVAAVHVSLPRVLSLTQDEYTAHLQSLVQAAMAKGFVMLNLAIYDIDELYDAQKHPEKHQDLIVRVWGYSARFVDLAPEMQEHIINRVRQ